MERTPYLSRKIAGAIGLRSLAPRTWHNLSTTVDVNLLGRMARRAASGGPDAEAMRQALVNAVTCSSAAVEDALTRAGIEATPRLLMRAAKGAPEVLRALRTIAQQRKAGCDDALDVVRAGLSSAGMIDPTESDVPHKSRPVAPVSPALVDLVEVGEETGSRLALIRPNDQESIHLTEAEGLLLWGVLRGVLAAMEIGTGRGRQRVRLASVGDGSQVTWVDGRRVAAKLRFSRTPVTWLDKASRCLLKKPPTDAQMQELDAAAMRLAAALQEQAVAAGVVDRAAPC